MELLWVAAAADQWRRPLLWVGVVPDTAGVNGRLIAIGWRECPRSASMEYQPTWRAKMRRGISLSAKSQEVEIGCTSGRSYAA